MTACFEMPSITEAPGASVVIITGDCAEIYDITRAV